MPQPAIQDVHVDRILTNISIAYMNQPGMYIADRIFPNVPVDFQSDIFISWNKNDWFRDEAQKRAPATESEGGGYTRGPDFTYFADNWAYHKDIPDEVRRNSSIPMGPDRNATRFVTEKLRLRRERAFAADFFTTGVWGTDDTTATNWDDYSNSDPIGNIETAREVIFGTTGFEPNTLVLGRAVWSVLKNHPDFYDRIKYVQRGVNTIELVQELFGIERILIGNALYATNAEGATEAYDKIWGKNALLAYVAPAPALETPSAGYTFVWSPFGGGDPYIRRLRNDFAMFDRVEGHLFFDQKAIATDLGYFFSGIVT